MNINGAKFNINIAAPNFIKQLFTGEYASGLFQELMQ